MGNKEVWEEKLSWIDKRRQSKAIKYLLTLDKKEWLSIHWNLNRWEWPRVLRKVMPPWWKTHKLPRRTYVFSRPLMEIIEKEFSLKEQLYYHNVLQGNMSHLEFEYWFENARNKPADLELYYER